MDDLAKLVSEKEELLKLKHKQIEEMQDKVLRTYAEMENVMDRTRREAENAKKYAIQVCCLYSFSPLLDSRAAFMFLCSFLWNSCFCDCHNLSRMVT